MGARKARMHPEWAKALETVLGGAEMEGLRAFLRERMEAGAEIYPPARDWFTAFDLTPLSRVRVVILGQDPYHGPGQAHGLSFSVRRGLRIPPSLHNIHKELQSDTGVEPPEHGNLEAWAEKGVLLLNSVLTVEAGAPGSHRGKGWETLTEAALRAVSERGRPAVFVAWGREAQERVSALGLPGRNLPVVSSPHPAPLSARGGFFGSRPFSRVNALLEEMGEPPIDWSIPA